MGTLTHLASHANLDHAACLPESVCAACSTYRSLIGGGGVSSTGSRSDWRHHCSKRPHSRA
eukprot:9805692-Lingulodinium_polyedra.AAC.1